MRHLLSSVRPFALRPSVRLSFGCAALHLFVSSFCFSIARLSCCRRSSVVGSGFDVASDSPEAAAAAASDPWVRASSKGKLRVLLKSAAGLLSADSNGLSDPYCRVRALANAGHKMDIVTKKSKTIKKTLDPVWNEELSFEGTLQSFLSYGLMIHIVDYDTFSKDDPLGDVTVPLDMLGHQDSYDFNEVLPTQGSILFTVTWTPVAAAAAAKIEKKCESANQLLIK